MEKYKRLTKESLCYSEWVQEGNPPSELYYVLKELENKIENGTLVDTTNVQYEKEEGKDRYIIYNLSPAKMIFDFADTKEEAEQRIKELKGKE